nr:ORF1 [Torque teno arctocephalus australis virus 4]
MVYYYRRRNWYPRRGQRRRFRYRRRFYHRRPWYYRRRYQRRQTVRRSRRRLRRRRHPRVKQRVVTWRPPRVLNCKIKGWDIGLASNFNFITMKGESIYKSPSIKSELCYIGGGVSVRPLSLRYFYEHNLKRWNIWTKSNQGTDLARYKGTKITLYRHQFTTYIFWWKTEFGDSDISDYQHMHPAYLLLRKNKVIMHSKQQGGRRKKTVFLRPPSTQESKWYSQQSWCNVNLAQIGFTPCNFMHSFWHLSQKSFGIWIGYFSASSSIAQAPAWSFDGLKDFQYLCMYRWYWDTGEKNYLLLNERNTPYGTGEAFRFSIKAIDLPYYQYFYGEQQLKGVADSHRTNKYLPIDFPNIMGIWWYADTGVKPNANEGPIVNRYIQHPDQLQIKSRVWVLFTPNHPNTFPNRVVQTQADLDKLPTVEKVATILTGICSTSPFAVHGLDNPAEQQTVNIPFTYSSYWQWGGAPYTPGEPNNPCDSDAQPGRDPSGVSISDPAAVSLYNLHPWDVDQQRVVTRDGLYRLLSEIFTPGTHGIQPGQAETQKETEEGGEQETSSYNSSSGTSTETTDTEEETAEERPREKAVLLRQVRKLKRRMEQQQQFQQQLRHKLKLLKSS